MKNNLKIKNMLNPIVVHGSNHEFNILTVVNLDFFIFFKLNVFISSFIL
jgi:hypothetical protein